MNKFATRNFEAAERICAKAIASKDEVTARKYMGLLIGMLVNATDSARAVEHFNKLFERELDTLPLAKLAIELKSLKADFGLAVRINGRLGA